MADFADYPESVAERRSDKTGAAKDWSPRDVLISLLRDIDGGELKPEAIVVCIRAESQPGHIATTYRVSSPDPGVSVGLMEFVKLRMLRDGGSI